MMHSNKGRLIISPREALLIKDVSWIGKMDPYVIIEIGNLKFVTQVDKNGGKTPKWNEVSIGIAVVIGGLAIYN
jgi:Ca2+-dependent lipid-binding protein